MQHFGRGLDALVFSLHYLIDGSRGLYAGQAKSFLVHNRGDIQKLSLAWPLMVLKFWQFRFNYRFCRLIRHLF